VALNFNSSILIIKGKLLLSTSAASAQNNVSDLGWEGQLFTFHTRAEKSAVFSYDP
jgi:hypothetical protein